MASSLPSPVAHANGHGSLLAASTPADDEATPWHDPTLSLDERMQLAEGKPLARRLMAAMAQLDCGAAATSARRTPRPSRVGEEKDLTRCTPGGKATAKKLREIVRAFIRPSRTHEWSRTHIGEWHTGYPNCFCRACNAFWRAIADIVGRYQHLQSPKPVLGLRQVNRSTQPGWLGKRHAARGNQSFRKRPRLRAGRQPGRLPVQLRRAG